MGLGVARLRRGLSWPDPEPNGVRGRTEPTGVRGRKAGVLTPGFLGCEVGLATGLVPILPVGLVTGLVPMLPVPRGLVTVAAALPGKRGPVTVAPVLPVPRALVTDWLPGTRDPETAARVAA